jgi:hypothetical protein
LDMGFGDGWEGSEDGEDRMMALLPLKAHEDH